MTNRKDDRQNDMVALADVTTAATLCTTVENRQTKALTYSSDDCNRVE